MDQWQVRARDLPTDDSRGTQERGEDGTSGRASQPPVAAGLGAADVIATRRAKYIYNTEEHAMSSSVPQQRKRACFSTDSAPSSTDAPSNISS